MAATFKAMKGWELIMGDDVPGRILRRSKAKTSISLRRELDDLEVKEGDTLILGSEEGESKEPKVVIVKEISMATEKYLIIKVLLFTRRALLPKEAPIPEIKDDDSRFITNEVYLTPEMESIQLKDILQPCKVISASNFSQTILDESKMDSIFVCRRFSDDMGAYFTDLIDWDDILKMFAENKDDFFNTLKTATIEPTLKKVNKQFQKQGVDPRTLTPDSSPRKKVIKKVTKQILGDEDHDLDDNISYSSSESESDSDLDEIIKNELHESKAIRSRRASPRKRTRNYQKDTPSKKRIRELPELPQVSRKLNFNEDFADGNDTTGTLHKAKKVLGTGAKIHSLPCRESEFHQLYHQLESAVLSQHGSCIYVSGTPGVGKTATIREVIKQLSAKLQLENDGLKLFNYVEINGLKLVSPQAAYELLWKKISGKQASANTSLSYLQNHFESTDSNSGLPLVVLLDELDQIVTRNQTVMYNFFNWPSFENSKLIVIAVANTMDLPERLLTNKISSRLGLTRIQFSSYTYSQLSKIITHRLENLSKMNDKLIIATDAIEFASRKVASVSGDARRSLMICIRAVEIAEMEFLNKTRKERKELDGKYTVTIMHIMKAVNETASSPITNYLYSISFMSKMVLAAILLRKKRTGLAEIQLGEVTDELNNQFQVLLFSNLKTFLKNEDMEFINTMYGSNMGITSRFRVNGYSYILKEFEEAGILVMQQIKSERNKLLRLNISDDEILTCFRRDPLMKELITFI